MVKATIPLGDTGLRLDKNGNWVYPSQKRYEKPRPRYAKFEPPEKNLDDLTDDLPPRHTWHDLSSEGRELQCYELDVCLEILPNSMIRQNIPSRFGSHSKEWITAKDISRSEHGDRCAICGGVVSDYHEVWDFSFPPKADLKDIWPICRMCHRMKHHNPSKFGPTPSDLISHFCRVANCRPEQYLERMGYHLRLVERRNKIDWVVSYGRFVSKPKTLDDFGR